MSERENMTSQPITGPGPRDLIEFHLRWPEFRHLAVSLGDRPGLPETEREIVRWLIVLADRVGPKDLLDE